jgi:hypothetical protein
MTSGKIDWTKNVTQADREAQKIFDTKARIAARRWEAQTAGITINGMVMDTSEAGTGLINGAALESFIDPDYILRWKTPAIPPGWIELTSPQVIAIARAVRAHVQACFDNEFALASKVDAGTFKESDLEKGWPEVPANKE